ncbi:hypothetical protein ABT317_35230 [Streptomyces carpinensis]|uniref:Uncharacterized protein n=1 Tax=Streptomyces carpinensis TaxID=66369 RepID=A0ABV1WD57_9ACTN
MSLAIGAFRGAAFRPLHRFGSLHLFGLFGLFRLLGLYRLFGLIRLSCPSGLFSAFGLVGAFRLFGMVGPFGLFRPSGPSRLLRPFFCLLCRLCRFLCSGVLGCPLGLLFDFLEGRAGMVPGGVGAAAGRGWRGRPGLVRSRRPRPL